MLKKINSITIIVAMVNIIFVNSVVSGIAQPAAVPIEGETGLYLRIALQRDIKTLNPMVATDEWTWKILSNIWDTAVRPDPDTLEVKPWIAIDWQCDTTCRNWTVYYRTGIYNFDNGLKFHDGHPVDIDDILFSYALCMQNPRWMPHLEVIDHTPNGTSPARDGGTIPMVRGIEKINDHTLRFRLNSTYVAFETNILSILIFPWHLWKDHFNPKDRSTFECWDMDNDSNPANGAPGVIGTGPFKFVKWDKYAFFAQLETFDDYFAWNKKPPNWNKEWYWEDKINWNTGKPYGDRQPRPYIDGLMFKVYMKTDLGIIALKKGEVDYIAWNIDPSYLTELTRDPNVGVAHCPGSSFSFIAFNMRRLPFGYDGKRNDTGYWFRKAVEYCINKQMIVDKLFQGYATVGTSVIPPANKFWHNESIPKSVYNPAKAAEIFDKQGWIDTDGDGFREFPGIGDTQITLIHPYSDYCLISAVAERMITEELREIGVNIRSFPHELGEEICRIANRDFEICTLILEVLLNVGCLNVGWEPYYLYDLFHSSQSMPGGWNFVGYYNASFNAIIEQAMREINLTERQRVIKWCQGILAHDLPYIVLYYPDGLQVYRKDRFSGWRELPEGILNAWSLLEVHKTGRLAWLTISYKSGVKSNSTVPLYVRMVDEEKLSSVSNATIIFNASQGTVAPMQTKTNLEGIANSTFYAPYVPPDSPPVNVTITATALHSSYEKCVKSITITVYPLSARFLSIQLEPAYAILSTGSTGTLRVFVSDQNGACVPDATVNLTASGTNVTITPGDSITDLNGEAEFKIKVFVDANTMFVITVRATKAGYLSATSYFDLYAVKTRAGETADEAPYLAGGVVFIFVISTVVIVCYRLCKKRVRNK